MRRRLLAVVLLLAACDATADGRRAWDEGRIDAARELWVGAAERAGASASPELLIDAAIASLRLGDAEAAESFAARAADAGGRSFEAFREFLTGNAAFVRAEAAETQTFRPGAGPEAFDAAIALAEQARDAWAAALVARGDWPEAARNAERAELMASRLRKRRESSETEKRSLPGQKKPQPRPAPPRPSAQKPVPKAPEPKAGDPSGEPPSGVAQDELPADAVAKLLERLDEKEREKTGARRDRREQGPGRVERDW